MKKNFLQTIHKRAFTLIEILLVISLMAILAAVVIIAINPTKQLADSRDAEREADVFTILQALYQYAADNEGDFPSAVSSVHREICSIDSESCVGLVDLSVLTDNQTYLVSIPADPLCTVTSDVCAINGTGYFLSISANERLTLTATGSETRIISVTK